MVDDNSTVSSGVSAQHPTDDNLSQSLLISSSAQNFSLSEFPQDLGSQLAAIAELLQNQQAEIASLKDTITTSEAKHLTAIENLEKEVLSQKEARKASEIKHQMAIKKLEKELVSLKESVQDQNRQNRGARPFIRILYRQEHTPWLMLIQRMWEWHISGIRSLRAPILLVVARP